MSLQTQLIHECRKTTGYVLLSSCTCSRRHDLNYKKKSTCTRRTPALTLVSHNLSRTSSDILAIGSTDGFEAALETKISILPNFCESSDRVRISYCNSESIYQRQPTLLCLVKDMLRHTNICLCPTKERKQSLST
jgi:hypothetical protein